MPIPPKKEVYNRQTAKERVYKTLQQWIIDGTFRPNERLNDTELAEYFSVSRTPVREALQMLKEQNLVHIIPSSGTYVTPIDLQDMKYVYELLGELQSISLKLCINQITAKDLSCLTELNERFLENANHGSSSDAHIADRDFHNYLAKITSNPYLITFTDQLTFLACRNENHFFKEVARHQASYENHCRIIAAIKTKSLSVAQQEIKNNWLISISDSY